MTVIPMESARRTEYPRNRESVRPYRFWNATTKRPVPYRYYKIKEHAHNGALIECRWAKVGMVIEVYDTCNGRLLGQYKRTVDLVEFMDG